MKILIWGENKSGGPYDVQQQLDYSKVYSDLEKNYHCNQMNVGNKVWIQGIISELSTEENELYFYNPEETWEKINSRYDKIVYSAANMLHPYYNELIETVTSIFKNSKIPVYVIAIGTQASSYNELDDLVIKTREPVAKFMDCIYETGGEIACRGYFTKEYLDKIASNTAVATGCPSLFQNGRNLRIEKKDNKNLKKIILNGNIHLDDAMLYKYPGSVYIDQGEYLGYRYDLNKYNDFKYVANLISKMGKKNAQLFLNNDIKVFYDMAEWHWFIKNGGYDFSLGSRIHGNIMSILAGIPAAVYAIDSRVREMAEIFNIPIVGLKENCDIQEIYNSLDYNKFNDKFRELFDQYEEFLKKCGLVEKMNQNNIFWKKNLPMNNDLIEEKRKKLLNIIDHANFRERLYFIIAEKYPRFIKAEEVETVGMVEKYK